MKDVRIALIGCGNWGRNLARNLDQIGVLAAICDQDEDSVKAIASPLNIPIISLEELKADQTIDAVCIATPPVSHANLSREILRAGKDVFVEKPLALDLNEANELKTLASESGRILMVGHLLRYHPAFIRLCQLVAEDEIGDIRYIHSNRLNLGKIRSVENALWSFAPHDISMILALLQEQPISVKAIGRCFVQDGIADVTTTHLDFASGASAHIFVSWLNPVKEQQMVVVGRKGMIVFDDGMDWEAKLTLYRHAITPNAAGEAAPSIYKADGIRIKVEPAEPLKMECMHFVECVRDRRQPVTDAEEAARVLAVLDAAQKSMDGFNDGLEDPQDDFFLHQSAFIAPDVRIGAGTKIWHFSHVMSGAEIGEGCVLGQNTMIGPRVQIGDRCKIQNNVSIYESVKLEDDVFVGPSVVFTNVLNPRAAIERKSEFKPTYVCEGASIGANATIVCGIRLGSYCFIGAGAVVIENIPDYAMVVGNPARQIGWMSRAGYKLGDDLICPVTKEAYELDSGILQPVSNL